MVIVSVATFVATLIMAIVKGGMWAGKQEARRNAVAPHTTADWQAALTSLREHVDAYDRMVGERLNGIDAAVARASARASEVASVAQKTLGAVDFKLHELERLNERDRQETRRSLNEIRQQMGAITRRIDRLLFSGGGDPS